MQNAVSAAAGTDPPTAAHPQLAIVGIYSGGAWIAERLVRDLQLNTAAGSIDVSFYRDDYAEKVCVPASNRAIPFEVDGAQILLVDDVLYGPHHPCSDQRVIRLRASFPYLAGCTG
jgi:pyrimidine operon attenuation protein/uracil phosphoribosyltransferase